MEEVYLVQYYIISQYSADTKQLTKLSYRVVSVLFRCFFLGLLFFLPLYFWCVCGGDRRTCTIIPVMPVVRFRS